MGANTGKDGGGATHAVRSVPFRQTGLASGGSQYTRYCCRGIACGALDGGDALPVLDQNERQHHLCDCSLSQLVSMRMISMRCEATYFEVADAPDISRR